MIDKAGNETSLFDNAGTMEPCYFDSLSLANLQGFVNENKLLELDENGSVVFSLSGEENFYSGEKVDYEQGIYDSELFNGTNDLIKWDRISWRASAPANTEVFIYVRANASRTDILLEDWVGPFTVSQGTGVDISSLTGQFLLIYHTKPFE